jgi:hypothetical protein
LDEIEECHSEDETLVIGDKETTIVDGGHRIN